MTAIIVRSGDAIVSAPGAVPGGRAKFVASAADAPRRCTAKAEARA